MSSAASTESSSPGEHALPLTPIPQPSGLTLNTTDGSRSALRMGMLLAALVVVLAFLLASSPARSSDFWRHLAAGRSLLERGNEAGVDPFTYTSDGSSWVNHSWLYDLVGYGVFLAAGGVALVICKALLMAVLAGVLIACGRVGNSLLIPSIAAAISLIALAPWMSVRPIIFSYLFLGLTIWFLESGTRQLREIGSIAGLREVLKCYWPLLAIIVLWVNIDSWFLLGPLTAMLYFLGQLLSKNRATLCRQAYLVPALGLAACLLNPHHAAAIRLPAEWWLSANAAQLQSDPALSLQLIKPFWHSYFGVGMFPSAAGLAYWFLVLAGVFSFVMARKNLEPWRLLVFFSLLLLSFVQGQAIGFFALAAGPILALNAGDWLVSTGTQFGAESRWAGAVSAGRLAVAFLILAAVAAAWTGWLVGAPYGPRRWAVELDSALEQAARQIKSWRQQKLLAPTDRGFNFSLEAANTLAWLYPAEKNFLDSRLQVAPERIAEFVSVRKGLMALGDAKSSADWRTVLRNNNINHIVLYSQNRLYLEAAFRGLLSNPDEWPLLFFGDGAAIFGWRDPSRPAARNSFADMEVNFEQMAFDPAPSELAPPTWNGRFPRPYYWWHAFYKRQAIPSPDLEEANLALVYHDSLKPLFAKRNHRAWTAMRCADIVARAGHCLPPLEEISQSLSGMRTYAFYLGVDESSRAPLFVAIRAIRRALHKDQFDSARAYFLLGETYHRLANTSERKWVNQYSMLPRLRTIQSIYGFSQAVALDPDNDVAHGRLGAIYVAMNFKDLAVKHYKELLRIQRARGPEPGESLEGHMQRIVKLQKRIEASDKELAEAQERLELRFKQLKVAERAQFAMANGLGGKALEILLKSDYAAFGNTGMDLELKLLLATGAMEQVRAWVEPDQEKLVSPFTVHWNLAQAAGAIGDYDDADANLLAAVAKFPGLTPEPLPMREAAAIIIGAAAIDAVDCLFPKLRPPIMSKADEPGMRVLLPDQVTAPITLRLMATRLTDEAEINTVRGLLALEAGNIDRADKCFSDARAYFASTMHAMTEQGSQPGPYLADDMAAMMARARRPARQ